MNENEIVKYYYKFKFSNGNEHTFTLNLSPDRMSMAKTMALEGDKPDWVNLGSFRCENCTLDEKEHQYCPVAESLVEIIEAFKETTSVEIVDVVVRTPEREMSSSVSIQQALGSLLGLYMATCGCPILKRFAPMAKFHLPFASVEETMYRSISNYLLAQYFILKEGGEPDWELESFRKFYGEVETVNISLCARVRSACLHDANINAVIVLDNFAKNITYLMDNVLTTLRDMFKGQIEEAVKKK